MNKWINVKDEMPNDCKQVLVTDGYDMAIGELYKGSFINDEWIELEYLNCPKGITHWMPLPKLPEPKTKQESLFDINEIPPFDRNQIKRTIENALIAHDAKIGRLCDKNGNFIKTYHVDDINDERKCNDWQSNLIKIYKNL